MGGDHNLLVLLNTARVPSVCCVRVLPAHSLAIGRATACVISCLETGLCPFEISALVTQPAQFALSAQITWLLLHLRGTQHVSNQTNTGFKLIQNPCAWYGVRHVRSHACRKSGVLFLQQQHTHANKLTAIRRHTVSRKSRWRAALAADTPSSRVAASAAASAAITARMTALAFARSPSIRAVEAPGRGPSRR